jgi:hypothetical protein
MSSFSEPTAVGARDIDLSVTGPEALSCVTVNARSARVIDPRRSEAATTNLRRTNSDSLGFRARMGLSKRNATVTMGLLVE